MGEFKEEKWEFSDEVEVEREWKSIQEGRRNLRIKDAMFDADEQKYTILFDDIDDEGVGISMRYWLNTEDENTQQLVPNNRARATLISLGRALAGHDIGIPKDKSIIGGVVVGDVVYYKESKYPKIFRYFPAADTVVMLNTGLIDKETGEIKQYSIPDEEAEEEAKLAEEMKKAKEKKE